MGRGKPVDPMSCWIMDRSAGCPNRVSIAAGCGNGRSPEGESKSQPLARRGRARARRPNGPTHRRSASNLAEDIGEQERLDAGNMLPCLVICNGEGRTRLECRGELNRIGGSEAVTCPQGCGLEQDGARDRF